MRQRKILFAVLAGLFFLPVASQLFAQEDVIKKRIELMKSNNSAAKAIKKALKEKDFNTIESKAKVIAGNMDKVLDLFPKGSTSEKSRAKPEIWEKWDEFSKLPGKVKAAAEALAKAAVANDEAEVRVQIKAIGGFRSVACGNCHKSFVKPRKKKKK
ncbi:MAG: c-type cytochrome [Candidatus Binatia bacterium]